MDEAPGEFRADVSWLGCNGVIAIALVLAALAVLIVRAGRKQAGHRPAD